MLTFDQARTMLTLQARINARVDPDWIAAAYPYLRAALVEGAEAIEHHGWKWWKRQARDLEQLRMELVDIWHFDLSHLLLQNGGDQDRAASELLRLAAEPAQLDFDGRRYDIGTLDTLTKLELSIGLAASRRLSLPLFAALLEDCGMDWSELFRQYVGKNVLNLFRQDHGYKDGSYRKLWGGREDNAHLVEVMAGLDPALPDYEGRLYGQLRQRYLAD